MLLGCPRSSSTTRTSSNNCTSTKSSPTNAGKELRRGLVRLFCPGCSILAGCTGYTPPGGRLLRLYAGVAGEKRYAGDIFCRPAEPCARKPFGCFGGKGSLVRRGQRGGCSPRACGVGGE